MAVEAGPMSGFRDLRAEQMLPREQALDTIKDIYENYGFVPLKTPALERYETLAGKYGEEGEKLMYRFTDNGGRQVAMRYDQTVPLARVVAQYGSQLPSPYKRYALGEVWRGESPQAGRFREFTQFDADTVGSSSIFADTEIIAMMSDSMKALKLDTIIRVNDRRILDGLAERCGIEDDDGFRALVGMIDKCDKIGQQAVLQEVDGKFGKMATGIVADYLSAGGSDMEKLDHISHLLQNENAQTSIESIRSILGSLSLAGYTDSQVQFDPTIARGLDYYTSTVYETTLVGAEQIGSVCSGGRYDKLIHDLGGPDTPAVGTSIGVDRLLEGMLRVGIIEPQKTKTQFFVTNMDDDYGPERFRLVQTLRSQGIAAELYFEPTRLGRQLKYIDRLGVQIAIIMGEEEVKEGTITVKNLKTGQQHTTSLDSLMQEILQGDQR